MSLLQHFSSDPNAIMNDFRMSVSHPQYEKITLYVEGETDVMLFRNIINEQLVKLIPVRGKRNVIDIMKGLYINYIGRVYAVCDADFDHIREESQIHSSYGIFVTDYHDIEVMMLLSSALKKIVNQKSIDNSNSFSEKILTEVIAICSVIGLFRLINLENSFNVKFSAMNFNEFVKFDEDKLLLDLDKLLEQLIRISPTIKVNKKELTRRYLEYSIEDYDFKQLCCGHDCTNVLSIFFTKSENILGKNFKKSLVEKDLILAFNEYDKYSVFNNVKQLA